MQWFQFRSQLVAKKWLNIRLTNSMQNSEWQQWVMDHEDMVIKNQFPLSFLFFFFLPVVAIWLTAAHVLVFKYSHTPHIQPAKQMPDVLFLLFLPCLPMYDNTNKTHKPIPELRFWDQLYYLAKTFSLNEIFNLYQPHLIIGICYIKLNCFVFSFSFRIYCH